MPNITISLSTAQRTYLCERQHGGLLGSQQSAGEDDVKVHVLDRPAAGQGLHHALFRERDVDITAEAKPGACGREDEQSP